VVEVRGAAALLSAGQEMSIAANQSVNVTVSAQESRAAMEQKLR
jgi:hypothetical protein